MALVSMDVLKFPDSRNGSRLRDYHLSGI